MGDADVLIATIRGLKREAAALGLRELAKTAREDYCGLAAYDWRHGETEAAELLATIADRTADRLEQEADPCPYTHAHTRHFCGYDGCRDS